MTIIDTVQYCDWRELSRRVREEVGQVDALIKEIAVRFGVYWGTVAAICRGGYHRRPS